MEESTDRPFSEDIRYIDPLLQGFYKRIGDAAAKGWIRPRKFEFMPVRKMVRRGDYLFPSPELLRFIADETEDIERWEALQSDAN